MFPDQSFNAAGQTNRVSSGYGGTAVAEVTNRVYVIDDDASVLAVVESMLRQAGYDVVAFLSSTRFLAQMGNLPRGVVVTDQVMHDAEGTEVQRRLSARPNDFRVILVTAFPRTSLAVAAMKAGAVTVLDKPFDRAELLDAISEGFRQLEEMSSDEQTLPPLLPEGQTFFDRLSEREQEVIRQVYEGATNKSIGIQLGISIKTVEKHRGKGMKKMQVGSLAGLIRLLDREFGKS
ncbi:MAG: response regulator transcription factor [Planctomycetaceae bacterium]|nr:response regulator transcription factor [Planctomycetaceae bacterium]